MGHVENSTGQLTTCKRFIEYKLFLCVLASVVCISFDPRWRTDNTLFCAGSYTSNSCIFFGREPAASITSCAAPTRSYPGPKLLARLTCIFGPTPPFFFVYFSFAGRDDARQRS